MDDEERLLKKAKDAALLRDVPAARSLEMAFELIRFARALNEAATRAPA